MTNGITFNGQIWVDYNSSVFLAHKGIQLLEKIDDVHSIAEAARQLGMGYKTAWEMLDRMNTLAEEPLVIRTKGGRHGGGTLLTDYAKHLIATFRTLEQEYHAMLLSLQQRFPELSKWQTLEQPLQLRTSARNQIICTIAKLEDQGHAVKVTLDLGLQQFLQAQVTQASIQSMGLAVGRQVVALIKAPLIQLSENDSSHPQMLESTVIKISKDQLGGAELKIALKSHQILIASLDKLPDHIVVGTKLYVAIDAKQIILAVLTSLA